MLTSFTGKKRMNKRPVKYEVMGTQRTSQHVVNWIPKTKKKAGILTKDGEAIPLVLQV